MTEKIDKWTAYVQQTAQLINLPLAEEDLAEVVDNLEVIAKIASLVTEFELPEEIESASTFEP